MARQGINPITLRGRDSHQGEKKVALTLGRLWVGVGAPTNKLLTAVIWEDTGEERPENIKAFCVLDEYHFINGLSHLFPAGEADKIAGSMEPVNETLAQGIRDAIVALSAIEGAAEIQARLKTALLLAGLA